MHTGAGTSFWMQFRGNRLAVAGAAVLVALHLMALLCPLLAPHPPGEIGEVGTELLPPSMEHPLGTDRLSRDVLSRILYGSRVSLLIGLLAMGIAVSVGTVYGAVSGYCGGRVDGVLMRVVDIFLAFPAIILVVTAIGIWGNESVWIVVVVIGLLSWMGVARLVRAQFLALKEREFFLAARALGAGSSRLIFRHLLPNSLTPVIVIATLGVGNAILIEAALSYLGLGVQPPTPSWGNIIFDNKEAVLTEWWIPFSAGLAIVVTVIGYNLLGDGLRDALDPRQKR